LKGREGEVLWSVRYHIRCRCRLLIIDINGRLMISLQMIIILLQAFSETRELLALPFCVWQCTYIRFPNIRLETHLLQCLA